MSMTYLEAREYLSSLAKFGSRPGLERVRELCRLLGEPQNSLRFIHISGTNGKGSVSAMLTSVLTEAGYKVGMYTSPGVSSYRERFMIGNSPVTRLKFAIVMQDVISAARSMEDTPTSFETECAAAFLYFAREKCDYVVLECGMGGLYDATNVIETTALAIITSVALDHTAELGHTTAEIAHHKAGIIKKSAPVVVGDAPADAMEVIKSAADGQGSTVYSVDFDKIKVRSATLEGTEFSMGDESYKLSLLGLYQAKNAAVVLAAVDALRMIGANIPEEAVREGLYRAKWPARFEKLMDEPTVIYDGAHNPHGIKAAMANIEQYLEPLSPDGRIAILTGVMADKSYRKMVAELSEYVRCAFAVTPDNPRALAAEELAAVYRENGVDARDFDSIEEGVGAAVEYAKTNKIPLLCIGTLYMYADVAKEVEWIKQKKSL